ncbi:hypothetical protein ACLOJK_033748 [Asimina triloba]
MDSSSPNPPPHKLKTPPPKPLKKNKSTISFIYTISCILLVITFQALAILRTSSPLLHQSQSPDELGGPTFHPLKDPKVPPYTHPNKTWFMSTLTGQSLHGMPEHFIFPSHPPHNMTLCMNSRERSYALVAAPPNAASLLRGLTVVVDSFYDYENPWHSVNALSVFFSWMMENECARPARFVVFRNGAVVKRIGGWMSEVMRACLGRGNEGLDGLEGYGSVCFEKAVVFRRGLGKMSTERRHRLFEMIRCKAWEYCNAKAVHKDVGGVKITLIGRDGKRAFRNESGMKLVMERECSKVGGCSLQVVHLKNMSFCDQVIRMRNTNILATAHGAQLSNMMFMAKGSTVMEMFPKGWLEGAGIGQYVYQWFASWCQMSYGAWRDATSDGVDCPDTKDKDRNRNCFFKHKDEAVGMNETFLAEWTASVIQTQISTAATVQISQGCQCDDGQ